MGRAQGKTGSLGGGGVCSLVENNGSGESLQFDKGTCSLVQ